MEQPIPQAVVVDTRDGHTWSHDINRNPFNETRAKQFAQMMNEGRLQGNQTFKAFKLVELAI